MTNSERVWMTRQAHSRLKTELSALHSPPSIEVPDDFMDGNDDRIAAHLARRARIGQIHDLLANAAVGQDPDDDVIAEPGMVLRCIRCSPRWAVRSPEPDRVKQRSYSVPSGTNLPVTLLHAVPYGTHVANTRIPQKIRGRGTGSRSSAAMRTSTRRKPGRVMARAAR
jgi:transcription elongation factor GreA